MKPPSGAVRGAATDRRFARLDAKLRIGTHGPTVDLEFGSCLSPSTARIGNLLNSNGNHPQIPLKDCPGRPNCVCTIATRTSQAMEALPYHGSGSEAIEQVLRIVSALPRVEVLTHQENYLHTTFRSRIFRFVDDVEFFAEEQTQRLHFRSASRLGYSDLGANRQRMQQILQTLLKQPIFSEPLREEHG